MIRRKGLPYRHCDESPPPARQGKMEDVFNKPRQCCDEPVEPCDKPKQRKISPVPSDFPNLRWWR